MTDEVKSEPREYIVLVRDSGGNEPKLTELGPVQAGSAHAAIRTSQMEHAVDVRSGRRFVAVPVRNWTETEGGLDKPKPKFRLTDVAYVPPGLRAGEVVEEPEPDTKDAD